MRPIPALIAGMIIGGLIAVLLMAAPGKRPRAGAVWRERAERSERELAAARRQLETVATQLADLSTRFEGLTTRFEALQVEAAGAGVAVPATAAPTP